jgi:hypothetical protein
MRCPTSAPDITQSVTIEDILEVPVEDAAASSNDRYERSLRDDGDRQWAVRTGRQWADWDGRQHPGHTKQEVSETLVGTGFGRAASTTRDIPT